MSATKDQLQDARGAVRRSGEGREWADVSGSRPCPVCRKASWCQVKRDGSIVLCKRIGGGTREKVNQNGITIYVHHLDPAHVPTQALRPTNTAARASIADCDLAYRTVLASLRLDDVEIESLQRRGLDRASIALNGYRTLPDTGRAALARAVIREIGEDAAACVPGIAWRQDGGRGWWTFAGWSGLLVPVRDADGCIGALKVRRRDPVEDGSRRYVYITSSTRGGASARAGLHVPLAVRAMRDEGAERLVITEGELKADVATYLLGEPVVGLPGVAAFSVAVELAAAWKPRQVVVALDMDAATNLIVARGTRALVELLRGDGHSVQLWRWSRRWKGLDDMLAAKARGELHRVG